MTPEEYRKKIESLIPEDVYLYPDFNMSDSEKLCYKILQDTLKLELMFKEEK